jgi:hypothetical protein
MPPTSASERCDETTSDYCVLYDFLTARINELAIEAHDDKQTSKATAASLQDSLDGQRHPSAFRQRTRQAVRLLLSVGGLRASADWSRPTARHWQKVEGLTCLTLWHAVSWARPHHPVPCASSVCTKLPQDLLVPRRYIPTSLLCTPTLIPPGMLALYTHSMHRDMVMAVSVGFSQSRSWCKTCPRTVGPAHCWDVNHQHEYGMSVGVLILNPPALRGVAMQPTSQLAEFPANTRVGLPKAPSGHPHEVEGLPAGASCQPGQVTDRRPVPIAGRPSVPGYARRVWQKVQGRPDQAREENQASQTQTPPSILAAVPCFLELLTPTLTRGCMNPIFISLEFDMSFQNSPPLLAIYPTPLSAIPSSARVVAPQSLPYTSLRSPTALRGMHGVHLGLEFFVRHSSRGR